CGAEVQKGNAPEERKLQRFFRNPQASRLIKRCNDFGAGGVSVAIGELADGVSINLDAIPRKYAGLDGTELAISESQERMAAVVAARDVENFLALTEAENLSATVVAEITREPRLAMHWQGRCVVDLPRSFIDSNGARKHAKALVDAPQPMPPQSQAGFAAGFSALVRNLNTCSKRGLSERFDSTVGAYTVLMPFGGKRQRTPPQAMVAKLPVEGGETDACTAMAWGYDPFLSETSPYSGAYAAVVSSVAKLVATGTSLQDCYLTFQEYFGKPGTEPARWGKPAASLLGALEAQLGLGIAAIGGKDSMSGSFESMDVPPTLVSFAVALCNAQTVVSPEFKQPGSQVVLLAPQYRADGMPEMESLKAIFSQVQALTAAGKALAVYTPTGGGIAEAVLKMCMGNGLGFAFDASMECGALFKPGCGAFVIELKEDCHLGLPLGVTLAERVLAWRETRMPLDELEAAYEGALEDIFPADIRMPAQKVETITFHGAGRMKPRVKNGAIPRVLIPVFPGTNCEYESARAVERGGAKAEVVVINTLSPAALQSAIREFAARLANSQALFLPGGFSNGDEPDGSGKFIAAFLRNPLIAEELMKLLEVRDGLVLGICNGFQALIKLGLLPYGRMMEPSCASPTLTYNAIGRHQSRLVRIRVSSNLSPWLLLADVGKVYTVPISHGEGRFLCPPAAFSDLVKNGQIAAQYVDADGKPSMQSDINPNGSFASVEAITSPDGRILGKMGHSERIGKDLYKNVPGVFDMRLFESAVEYFK
ncbi:MAG: phosphoribosylformylglycinamidine synthase, partial [Clostridia bacterium]|nr:phosphoribosylformylglycinamidine synthase [Clostridia bacterium]